ncbi:tetratricopeptide repeat protein [Nonomuraea longispora]|uniref:Tetratricopeptide repeat protein n=1 Tax=Nonomuraea longispora TaxID=1848320 RepID=A0A4V2XJJ4_9ACTN|nr:BTAD domain-containing putative transcriptional regulator [Nonomuraea longispora]TDC02836.1 tetratricopeptide repeat protein [Nonomuraea longispora]
MADAFFNVLGPVQVCRTDGRQVHLTGKQRAVLATLLVNANTVVTKERLIDALWEDPPPSAIPNLVTYIAGLRKALPSGTRLVTMETGYLFEADAEEVDLLRFEHVIRLARSKAEEGDLHAAVCRYEEALSMWRGKPAEGTNLAGSMAARLAELEHRLAVARLAWADVKLALGQPADVIENLRLFIAEQPLHERAWYSLMLAHSQAGQRDRALEVFQHARAVLVDELGIEPGDELQQLQAVILAGPTRSSGCTAETPIWQLPSDVEYFSGRDAELATLDRLLPSAGERPPSTATICVISGAAGIGKTCLAVHWARRVRDLFPDGQLYVDLQGFSPASTPMTAAEAVRVLLGLLQPPHHQIPSSCAEQMRLFRALLTGRRVLILLDNAREPDQVRPLLPPSPGSLTLVTSRDALTGLIVANGAHLVRLSPLSDSHAGELLARRLGEHRIAAERDMVDAIVKTCAGLPLALGVVAARAIVNDGLPLAALAEELQSETTRLDALQTDELSTDLREVFGSSHRVLTPQAAGTFAHLGLAPGPDISLPAAASLIGQTVPQTRMLLRSLETAHLLHQHAPSRYRMHDLVRLYAIERAGLDLGADDRSAAVRRLVDFYLHTSHAADHLLSPHRRGTVELDPPAPGCLPAALADAAAAQDWFRAEHPCLLATQRLAAEHDLHAAVWQLAWTIDTYHLAHNLLPGCVAAWRLASSSAERLNDPAVHALVHRLLGRACARAGHYEESLSHLDDALALYEGSGDIAGQALVHHTLAVTQGNRGEHEQTLFRLKHALQLYRDVDDPLGEANVLNSLGWSHALLGDFAEAMGHCEQALALLSRHGDRLGESAALNNLGYIAHHTGRHEQAVDRYRHALTLRREFGHVGLEADTLTHLGETYRALSRYAEADRAWSQALAIYQAQHNTVSMRRVQARLEVMREASCERPE